MDKYIVNEYKCPNCTVRVHIPVLTPEEQRKRDENIKAALIRFGIERMRSQK